MAVLASCTTSGHSSRPESRSGGQLTLAAARKAFNTFLSQYVQLPLNFSADAARRLTIGAELQAQLFFRGQSGPGITNLTHEAFYVPWQTGYPRWFWAVGLQQGLQPAGHLFVMVQSAPAAPWRTAMALYDLNSTAGMLRVLAAAITLDAHGYALVVPLTDPTIDVSPAAMPATFARYLSGLATPAEWRLFQAGPNTTGYLSFTHQIARGARRYGWQDTDHQAPANLPVYALRLNTGGAAVIFATYDTAGWRAESGSAALPRNPSGPEVNFVPPGFVLRLLKITSVRAGMRITVTAVDRVLAFVQPKGVGFIYPPVLNGAATGVSESGSGP